MFVTDLFKNFREQKWVLYVPRQIYEAHQDKLLSGWGIQSLGRFRSDWKWLEDVDALLQILEAQQADLKLPFCRSATPCEEETKVIEKWQHRLLLHTSENDCPPFPEATFQNDLVWDKFIKHFSLSNSRTVRFLAWEEWVYRVRFVPVWATHAAPSNFTAVTWEDDGYVENREMLRQIIELRRRLRKEYGLTGEYFGRNYERRPVLMLLTKAYPPEQVRRVRRQVENEMRKSPAEAIRYAIERKLVK